MKCLIIAAGQGSRLKHRGDSKPLTPLLGLSLIERVILSAKNVGINDFYVVTGYHREKLSLFLDKLSLKQNIKITVIPNEAWEKGNGVSVFTARNLLKEKFILLMADHIFAESILRDLKDKKITDKEVVLAVDSNLKTNKLVDIDDVTKVLVKNNKISEIGKNLKEYNAYDTGIFLCSRQIFKGLEESAHKGDYSLSGGIRILAAKGQARIFDISANNKNDFWIDVDDEKSFKNAEKKLISELKKRSDGPISRYLNRPISLKITKYLLKTSITPNFISFFSFGLSMIGAFLFFLGGYINLVMGAILAQTASIIDGCDGEIARLKFGATEFGGWFDAVLDRYADAFLLLGLTHYVYFTNQNFLIIFIGFLAIIGAFMNSYTADKYDGLMKRRLAPGKNYFRIGRDVRIFIIFIGCLINQPLLVLILIAFWMNIENIRRIVLLYKS